MARVHDFFPSALYGSLSADLQDGGTTLSSPQLASLPAVTAPDTLALVLSHGVTSREIIWVTDHTADATTATIERGQEATVAAYWPAGTTWSHVPTDDDFEVIAGTPPLSGLSDVAVSSPADTEVLTYVDADSKWENKPAAGGLPSWFQSGAGSPVGVVTPAQQGALYQDTTNGALYEAVGVTNADWYAVGGAGNPFGTILGLLFNNVGLALVGGAPNKNVYITDIAANAGTGNSLYWVSGAADGQQALQLALGDASQFEWVWDRLGTTTIPGPLKMANGNFLYNTAAAPSNGVGADGDWSLGADGHIYAKAAGAWGLVI